jgi:hypothetical protein
LGGGREDIGAVFWDVAGVGVPLLTAGFAAEGALGRGFGATDEVTGLESVGLLEGWVIGLWGRGNCSSALRFVPEALFGRSVISRDMVLGLRASDLALEEDIGADWAVVTWGMGVGLPVSMDERTESRNYRKSQQTSPIRQARCSYTHFDTRGRSRCANLGRRGKVVMRADSPSVVSVKV